MASFRTRAVFPGGPPAWLHDLLFLCSHLLPVHPAVHRHSSRRGLYTPCPSHKWLSESGGSRYPTKSLREVAIGTGPVASDDFVGTAGSGCIAGHLRRRAPRRLPRCLPADRTAGSSSISWRLESPERVSLATQTILPIPAASSMRASGEKPPVPRRLLIARPRPASVVKFSCLCLSNPSAEGPYGRARGARL
eukprot:scaffold127345_cov30-Tisochrysis_lutea.AAC.2